MSEERNVFRDMLAIAGGDVGVARQAIDRFSAYADSVVANTLTPMVRQEQAEQQATTRVDSVERRSSPGR